MPSALVDSDAATCVRDCAGADFCRLSTVSTETSTFNAFTCGAPAGANPISCTDDADCVSGLCLGDTCTIPCGNQDDCSVFDLCLGPVCYQRGICGYILRGDDWVTGCGATDPADLPAGAACTTDARCQEGYCIASTGRCSETCCADADCAATSGVCRPVDHFGWEMRCIPRPPEFM